MVSLKTYFLFLVCGFLLWSCADLKEVQFTGAKGYKLKRIDAKGIEADIMLGIKNPNKFGFSVYRSKFDVTYNGIYLGRARSSKRVHVQPNTDKTYSFTLKSDFKNVSLMDIMKLVNGGGKGNMEVKGNLKIGKFFVKKRIPIDVKERVGL